MFTRRSTSSAATTAALAMPTDEMEQLYRPTQRTQRKGIDQLLLERGVINEQQLDQARAVQVQTPGKTIGAILQGMNVASEAQILEVTAQTLGIDFEVPDRNQIDPTAYELLPVDYIRKQSILPLRLEGDSDNPRERTLVVAMADPSNVFVLDEIKRKTKRIVRVVATPAAEINRLVEQIQTGHGDIQVDEIIKDMAEDDVQVVKEIADDVADLEKAGSESPIIRFVNYLIADAIKQGASDIHVEPKEKGLKIRYRIDGILFDAMSPPHSMHAAIVSRMKIMANLDISERRLPQDGRIRAVVRDRKIDLRMSTLPTANGEKVVMRILDNRSINVPLEALGFGEEALTIWRRRSMNRTESFSSPARQVRAKPQRSTPACAAWTGIN